jgi:hypothetical protein
VARIIERLSLRLLDGSAIPTDLLHSLRALLVVLRVNARRNDDVRPFVLRAGELVDYIGNVWRDEGRCDVKSQESKLYVRHKTSLARYGFFRGGGVLLFSRHGRLLLRWQYEEYTSSFGRRTLRTAQREHEPTHYRGEQVSRRTRAVIERCRRVWR